MKQVDELTGLVQSLSPTEKRYVRIFSDKHLQKKGNKYFKLFDQFLDENKKIPGKTTTYTAADRYYLHSFILKAMRSFHEGKDVNTHLKELLLDSQFLYEKRLYAQSLKILKKAKELANRFERYTILLEILFLESRIVIERESKQPLEALAEVHTQASEVLNHLSEDWPFTMRQQKIFLMQRTRFHIPENERSEFLEAPDMQLLHTNQPERFTPQYYSLFTQALYHHCLADYPNCLIAYEELIELWEKWPDRKIEESIQYKKILSNYLSICHRLSRFDRFPEVIERIKSIPCRNHEEEAEQFQNLQLLELLYLMNTDGYDELHKLALETREGLKRYRTKINKARELSFYYNFAVAYFIKHEWQTALEWLVLIINDDKNQHRQDIQHFSRVLRLVLWYELGKGELLEYELINTERFLRKRKAWTSFESTVVKLIDRLLRTDEKNTTEWLMKYRTQLENIRQTTSNGSILGFDELYYWVVSNIGGESMRDLIRSTVQ